MPRWSRRGVDRVRGAAAASGAEEGNAALEFLTAGVLLLVPLVYLILALASIQGASLAVTGAAGQAATVFVRAPNEKEGVHRADDAVAVALADAGVDAGDTDVGVSCGPVASCLRVGRTVTVTVRARVTLPLVPSVFGLDRVASVPVEARAVRRVPLAGGPR